MRLPPAPVRTSKDSVDRRVFKDSVHRSVHCDGGRDGPPIRITPAPTRPLADGLADYAEEGDAQRVSVGGGRDGLRSGLNFNPR